MDFCSPLKAFLGILFSICSTHIIVHTSTRSSCSGDESSIENQYQHVLTKQMCWPVNQQSCQYQYQHVLIKQMCWLTILSILTKQICQQNVFKIDKIVDLKIVVVNFLCPQHFPICWFFKIYTLYELAGTLNPHQQHASYLSMNTVQTLNPKP